MYHINIREARERIWGYRISQWTKEQRRCCRSHRGLKPPISITGQVVVVKNDVYTTLPRPGDMVEEDWISYPVSVVLVWRQQEWGVDVVIVSCAYVVGGGVWWSCGDGCRRWSRREGGWELWDVWVWRPAMVLNMDHWIENRKITALQSKQKTKSRMILLKIRGFYEL